jgi:plasmid maintenance system antidote protein VapI
MSITRKGTPIGKVHHGEVLREEFMKPMHLSAYTLAKGTVRLAKFFGTAEQFWLGLAVSV